MRGRLNYGGVKESGQFELIPEGEYMVKIVKVSATDKAGELLMTKAGDKRVNVQLAIVGGELDGRRLFHQVIFFPPDGPGAGMTKHFLKVIGEGEAAEGRADYDTTLWDSHANAFLATVRHETYEGVMRAKISRVDYAVAKEEDHGGLDL